MTRSGSNFPVAAGLTGCDVKVLYVLWRNRIRSYLKAKGAMFYSGFGIPIMDHCFQVLSDKPLTTHHIEVLNSKNFKREWVGSGSSSVEYTNNMLASCHVPFLLTRSFSNNGMIDGAMHIPFWTRRFPAKGAIKYKASIKINFEGQTTKGFFLGLAAPDCYIDQMDSDFEKGVVYANTVFRADLLKEGIEFDQNITPKKVDTSRVVWSMKENRFIKGTPVKTYKGFWWFWLFRINKYIVIAIISYIFRYRLMNLFEKQKKFLNIILKHVSG